MVIGMSVRKAIDEQRLAVAVRIADHELRRAGLARALDGGEHVGGHPLARLLILEARRPELVGRRDAGDAFHVGRDVDLERTLRAGSDTERPRTSRSAGEDVYEVRFA